MSKNELQRSGKHRRCGFANVPCGAGELVLPIILYFLSYVLQIFATTPLSASSASRFGITISPLKKSDSSHTRSNLQGGAYHDERHHQDGVNLGCLRAEQIFHIDQAEEMPA